MSKNKAARLIHGSFERAEIDPEPKHVAIWADTNQGKVRVILWPVQIPQLKAVLEQIESGATPAQPVTAVWEPVQ